MLRITKYGNPFATRLLLAKDDGGSGSGDKKKKSKEKDKEEDDEDGSDDEEDDKEDEDSSDEDDEDESDEDESDDEDSDEDDDKDDNEDDKKKSKKKSSNVDDKTKRAIEKARKEERTKVYSQIDSLKQSQEELKKTLKKQERLIEKQQAQLVAIGKAKTADGKTIDPTKLLDEAFTKFEESAATREADELKTLRKKVDRLTKENEQVRVEKLRAKLIRENGGDDEMVVELVSGETEEEILDSIETAKEAFERIAKRSKGSKKKASASEEDDEDDNEDEDDDESDSDDDEDEDDTQSRQSKGKAKDKKRRVPPEIRQNDSHKAKGGKLRTGTVASMRPDQYAQNRQTLLGQLQQKYGGSGAKPFGAQAAKRASRF